MKRKIAAAATAITLLTSNDQIAFADTAEDLLSSGTYVAVDDIAHSELFYIILLGGEPEVKLADFVAFDISGGWLALVSRDRYAPGSTPGAGSVPYIQSGNLLAVQSRVESATGKDAPDIIQEPGIHLLKIKDPDGQLIEFYMLTEN